jgi:hypothetical protein
MQHWRQFRASAPLHLRPSVCQQLLYANDPVLVSDQCVKVLGPAAVLIDQADIDLNVEGMSVGRLRQGALGLQQMSSLFL